jgi:hypothetical protein
MNEEYKDYVRSLVQETLASCTPDNPNDLTRLMLRNSLMAKGITVQEAEHIASKAHIAVPQVIFDDAEFMREVIDGYASIVKHNKTHAYLHYTNANDVFLSLSEGIAISFSVE